MQIIRVLGPLRARVQAFTAQHHYTASHGGSGFLFAIVDAGAILGACLVGPHSSMMAERAIIAAPHRVWVIKRLVCLDDCPVPESQLMRHAMRAVAVARAEPIMVVAMADPVARDERTGQPLLGWVYLAAGMFSIGETSQPRYAVLDHHDRWRSTRQGEITLSRRTLPRAGSTWRGELVTKDWELHKLPPARVWAAAVTPAAIHGVSTTRLWRKRAAARLWRALSPNRRVAAMMWIDFSAWRRRDRSVVSLGRPRRLRGPQQFQPALWPAHFLTRTAAPAWVPYLWQESFLEESSVVGERTLHRSYVP
jgi:hypothetical protein